MGTSTEAAYALARERYGALGVNTDEAIRVLLATPISLHCWQGDDVAGFGFLHRHAIQAAER